MKQSVRIAWATGRSRWLAVLLGSFTLLLIWSGYSPVDRFVWILEVLPAIVGAAVLIALYPRIKLTMLVYCLIWLHALVLMIVLLTIP